MDNFKNSQIKLCSYCGTVATCHDHVPPVSFYKLGPRKGKRLLEYPWVPAFTECNLLLSNKILLTVSSRAGYLARHLKARYTKLLSMPDWQEEELDELEDRVKESVLQALKQKVWIQHRIKTIEIIAQAEEDDDSLLRLRTFLRIAETGL